MVYGVYSIYDQAAKVFTSPVLDISDRSALRNFQQALANPGSVMNFKPEDFALYQVGTFDVETGYLDSFVPPSRLYVGSDGDIRKELMNAEANV